MSCRGGSQLPRTRPGNSEEGRDVYCRRAARTAADGPRLLAVSDLHVGFAANRAIAERIEPGSASDWLIVAGDVGERAADVEWVLGTAQRALRQGGLGSR